MDKNTEIKLVGQPNICVCYRDEKNRHFVFISNHLNLDANEIALIYKKRWGIELLFKKKNELLPDLFSTWWGIFLLKEIHISKINSLRPIFTQLYF